MAVFCSDPGGPGGSDKKKGNNLKHPLRAWYFHEHEFVDCIKNSNPLSPLPNWVTSRLEEFIFWTGKGLEFHIMRDASGETYREGKNKLRYSLISYYKQDVSMKSTFNKRNLV